MARPNILILMTDQQRGDCLSCAGHPIVQTPNMDRLAAGGVRFSRAYSTNPVCMPVRASFQSGQYSHNHGIWGNFGCLQPLDNTYPKSLRKVGYHTCHVGKSHLYPHHFSDAPGFHLKQAEPYMNAVGWDEVHEIAGPLATRGCDSVMTDRWKELGCLDTYRDDYAKRCGERPLGGTWPSPLPEGEHADDFVGRTAVEWLNGYGGENPFCLFVGFGGPHEPWDPPASWAEKYDPAAMDTPKPVTEPDAWVPEAAAAHQRQQQDGRHEPTDEMNGLIRARYYAKISHIDSWFGKILDTLEARGLADDTLVVFWSDHGEMLGDKARYWKSFFFEESVRVPLVVRLPGAKGQGSECRALASVLDVYPLLLDAAGCPAEEWRGFGRSLAPLLDDPAAPHHDAVFSEGSYEGGARVMIRTDRHKAVVAESGALLKLYDMETDPDEAVNLAGKPGTEAVEADLRDRLLRWMLRTQVRLTPQQQPLTLEGLLAISGT